MCGIAGIAYFSPNQKPDQTVLETMAQSLHHRGPDEQTVLIKGQVGLASSRLAVIDLPGGRQPLANEDKTVFTILNGEIYNYQTLTKELLQTGHHFQTQSDTEVIVHAWEEFGIGFLNHLNERT